MRPEMDYCCRGSGFLGQNRAVSPDWVACQHDSTASLTDSVLSSRKSPFALPQRQHCISQSPLSPIARCCNCFSFTLDINHLPQHVPQRPPSVDARCRRCQCCQPSLRCEYLLNPRPDRASHRTRRKTARIHQKNALGTQLDRYTIRTPMRKAFSSCFAIFSSFSEIAPGPSANLFFLLDPKCRTRHPDPYLRRSQGLSHRGLFYSRAAYPWCTGGGQPR